MEEAERDIVLGGMECKVVEIGNIKEVIFARIDTKSFYDWYINLQIVRNHGGFQSNIHPEVERVVKSGFNINKYHLNSNGVWTSY